MSYPDRFDLVCALIRATEDLGWRMVGVESSDHRVTFVAIAPLATSRIERNRWPDEPEEGPEDGA